MTDDTVAPTIPPLLQSLMRAGAQKGLTALATFLTVKGVIASDQQSGLIQLGLSAALWALSFGWTYFHEKHAKQKLVAAVNAAPPGASA